MLRLLTFLLFFVHAAPAPARERERAAVNAVGCSLFDGEGKVLKKYLGWICGFFPSGGLLLGDGFTLTFYDEKMNLIWSRDVHTHHMINVEGGTALVTASRILDGHVRIDRLEVYSSAGELLRAFDFPVEGSYWKGPQNWDNYVLPGVTEELSLIESFHLVPRNTSKEPFLAEGNYLAYDAAGRLYFFDRDLRHIVHQVNTREWGTYDLRDVQVTKRGTLLVYNSGHEEKGKRFSTLDERDPRTGKVTWSYRARPAESFFGAYEGNVQELPNGNFLYSMIKNELTGASRRPLPTKDAEPWMEVQGRLRLFEVTRAGKLVWTMSNDGRDLSGMPNIGRRLDLTEYHRRRGRY